MTLGEHAEPSDFIVYVDESGSPNLNADREDFPIFVLVFVMVRKGHYIDHLVPAVQRLKFDFLGHDQIVLHEREIRRQSDAFTFLRAGADRRATFLDRINAIVADADIKIACAIIDKRRLTERYTDPWDPYGLALTFCMEKIAREHPRTNGQRALNVIFEARGGPEDRELELEFRRIAGGDPRIGRPEPRVGELVWNPIFAPKASNSTGLQLADLAARPLGLAHLRPKQTNRAAEILQRKMIFPHPKVFP